MADPCVVDSAYIGLDTTGTPAVLEATLLNPEQTFSGTEGDNTTHVVTDHDVVHSTTHTFTIDNTAGTAPCRGIIVVALNPIWAGDSDGPVSLIWGASLTVQGIGLEDSRTTITTGLDEGDVITFSPGSLVGEVTVPAGATRTVTYEKHITNDGASGQWSFRMGIDKLVVQMGY